MNKRIVSPQKLKILVLSGNDLINEDLQFLSKCINLIKLDLSNNHISKIYQKYGLDKIQNLRLFMIENNKISQIQGILSILTLKNLQMISYVNNPIEDNIKAEHLIINSIHNLKIINYRIIFIQQRDPSLIIQRKNKFIQTVFQQWQPAQHSEKYYLRVLSLQMVYIDNMWMYNNPIIKIQRIWKAILAEIQFKQQTQQKNINTETIKIQSRSSKRQIKQIKKEIVKIQTNPLAQAFYIWKNMYVCKKQIKKELRNTVYYGNMDEKNRQNQKNKPIIFQNKQYLTLPIKDYYMQLRNIKIKNDYKAYLKRIRQKLYLRKMANILKRNISLKKLSFSDPSSSYYYLSGLHKSNKLYFNRIQQHLIQNFLAHIGKNFNKKQILKKQGKFGIANQYISIRLIDPDTYSNKKIYNPFTYLMWPCMRAVILKKKKFPYKIKSSIIKIKSLSYIKNKNKSLKVHQRQKLIQTYQKIDKFFQNQYYQSLGYFECSNQFIMQQLIRLIYYHNTKAVKIQKIIDRSQMLSLLQNYNENVAIYTQQLLQRTTSAVKIQQQWRRYINIKRHKQSIYQLLKKNRAARLIQKFIRSRIFYHRLSFQRNLSLDLTYFQENDILIHQKLYQNFPRIIINCHKNIQLYKDIKIQIQNSIKIYHSDCNNKQVFFPNLRKLHLNSTNYKGQNNKQNISQKKIDIYKLLHQNANVKVIQCQNQKFYHFTYSNIQNTKCRVAIIALITYKMYGSFYLLPLSKNTLHMYNNRIKIYKKYGIQCRQLSLQSLQKHQKNQMKFNVIYDISGQIHSTFIYIDSNYHNLFNQQKYSIKEMKIQFYQKKYQNFPQKYQNKIYFVNQKEKQTKLILNIQKYLIKNQELIQNDKNNQLKQTKINIIQPKVFSNTQKIEKVKSYSKTVMERKSIQQMKTFDLELFKNTERRFSLYAMDGQIKTTQEFDSKYNNLKQVERKIILEKAKKQKVAKFLETQQQKKYFLKQKKQVDLSKMRQKRRQQKIMNSTLKSLNQSQRTQNLRKKAQRIKQIKQRSLSSKKSQQINFVQQGNFIIEQQLKMNLMRNKIKDIEKMKEKKKSFSLSKDKKQTWHEKTQNSRSFKSIQPKNQKKILFQGSDIQLLQMKNSILPSAMMEKQSEQIFGEINQIINKRSYIKKRSSKTGAYLRDPSFVHGIFPEQYYPIATSGGGIVFPKV